MNLLPGHRLERFFVLDFGLFDVGPGKRLIGIPGFLLETDKGALILFDTGFPPEYATDPEGTARRDGLHRLGEFAPGFSARNTAMGQLALLGLSPGDISHVILSHGHIDHVGSLGLFAHAPIILTEVERRDPKPCYFFDARPMEWPDATYVPIKAAAQLCEGISLIPTPGHTAGHLSALLTLPSGQRVILAADAINRASEAAEGFVDAKDPNAAQNSHDALIALQKSTDAVMIYGHEPSQWPLLPKAPLAWA